MTSDWDNKSDYNKYLEIMISKGELVTTGTQTGRNEAGAFGRILEFQTPRLNVEPSKVNTATQCALHLKACVAKKNVSVQCAPLFNSPQETLKMNVGVQCVFENAGQNLAALLSASQPRVDEKADLEEDVPPLLFLEAVENLCTEKLNLKRCYNRHADQCLVISNHFHLGMPGNLDLLPIEITFTDKGKCTVNIVFREVEIIDFNLDQEKQLLDNEIQAVLNRVIGLDYVWCPGVNPDLMRNLPMTTVKHRIEILKQPFERCQAKMCDVWYYKPNSRLPASRCQNCREASRALSSVRRRTKPPKRKASSDNSDDDPGYSFGGPRSQARGLKKKLEQLEREKRMLRQRVHRLEHKLSVNNSDAILDDVDSDKVKSILDVLNRMEGNSNVTEDYDEETEDESTEENVVTAQQSSSSENDDPLTNVEVKMEVTTEDDD